MLIVIFTMEGCQVSSDQFLSFHNINSAAKYNIDTRANEGDFFSEDLAIVPEKNSIDQDSEFTSGATLLINLDEKKYLYADNIYEKLYPASLTKLLTALIVLRYGELTDSVTISYNASHIPEPGAKMCGFEEGDVISLDALLRCLLIYSGNDAGIAIAEHVGGSEETFVKKMNEEAKKIGAVHSNFVNSHGLHNDDQYTTAYDVYLIVNELIQYDSFFSIISLNSYIATYTDKDGIETKKEFQTTVEYLNEEEDPLDGIHVVGGKTGTTNKAGNCMVLLSKDNLEMSYLSILLKASGKEQLYTQMTHLLTYINGN